MPLTYKRLLKFDLLDQAEKKLLDSSNTQTLIKFFRLWKDIEKIDEFIKDAPAYPGTTDKIVRDEMISAIGATLAIELIDVSNDEIKESFRKADLQEQLSRKEQEAENSRKVYQFVQEVVSEQGAGLKYTQSMINQIHKYFTDGMNYLSNVPGQYRDFPVSFEAPRKPSLCRNRSEVEAAMTGLVDWLNKDHTGPLTSNSIAKAIVAHYYTGEIHPWGDGNGRTARALEALVLSVNGVNNYCFWSLANFWSLHRDQYLVRLHDVRQNLDAVDFVLWGMEGFLEVIQGIKAKVLSKVRQLMLIDHVRFLLDDKRNQPIKVNHRILDIMRILVKRGRMGFNQFRSLPEVVGLHARASETTKHRDWKAMEGLKIIRITKEGTKKFIEPNFAILEHVTY